MCLYPRLMKNKRYLMIGGNGKTKPIDDYRKQYVAIGCGHCIECRKQHAREWQIRLNEELKVQKFKYFVTLTFSKESLQNLVENNEKIKHNVNLLAARAVRLFLERWRKKHKKSLRHWLITELGHENTERIHLHGIIFTDFAITNDYINEIWKYGMTYTGEYCNEKTINYIVKYVTKVDTDHKGYEADIFCSSGIGSNYYKDPYYKKLHAFKGKDTIQYYTLPNGQKVALPIYYRRHFWNDEERGKLWTYLLDQDKTYIRGIEMRHISTPNGYNRYMRLLGEQQKDNVSLGYGTSSKEWDEKIYNVTFDMLHKSATKNDNNDDFAK